MKDKIRHFFTDQRTVLWLWILIAISGMTKFGHGRNNFTIFKQAYWHVVDQLPLYIHYPKEYFDLYLYGPVFSLIIGPYAIPPAWIGMLLWLVTLTLFLYLAVSHNVFTKFQIIFICWFCAHELLNSIQMQQFNIAIAAIILLTFYLIEKERDFWAAFFLVLGTLVKLYGIVGLAFILFSKHKGKFIGSIILWAVLMFVAPMIISSPLYIIDQYKEWMDVLIYKNADNMFSHGTNISLLGLLRKFSGSSSYSDLCIIIPGIIILALPLLRLKQYVHDAFRQTMLASVLIFTILFSTGSENSTYIIAVVGVAIWYTAATWQRSKWDVALMVYVFFFCTMAHSDLMPKTLREEWIKPYALKALPVALVWLKLCYEMMVKDYIDHSS